MAAKLNPVATVMALLEFRAGLCPEVLGWTTVELALKRISNQQGKTPESVSAELLAGHRSSWNMLLEHVTVPETWFLRHPEAFTFLSGYIQSHYVPLRRSVRILSCPCATGEEPYSIAITLLEAGIPPERIRIDAIDIAHHSIALAKIGSFTIKSLREQGSEFILNYAVRSGGQFQFQPEIRSLVHFQEENILEMPLAELADRYDIIFCRNLLIYLSAPARRQIIEKLYRALPDNGIVFTGNAENTLFTSPQFTRMPHVAAFAYAKQPFRPEPYALSADKQKPIRLQKQKVTKPCPDSVRDEQGAVPSASLELARRLANHGLLEQSSAMCRELLLRNPLDSSLHFLLGEISEAVGQSEESEKHFEQTLYSDPNHYESLIHLSLLRARKGEPKSSEYYLRRARRAALRAIEQQEHT